MFASGKPYMLTCLGHYSTFKRNDPVILKTIIEQGLAGQGQGGDIKQGKCVLQAPIWEESFSEKLHGGKGKN